MVTTPTSWIKSEEEGQYRGLAMSQMRILQQQLALGKLNMGTRVIKLDNGVVITCTKCFAKEDVHIHIPPVAVEHKRIEEEVTLLGVLLHPRSGPIKLMPHFEWESYQGMGALVQKKVLHGVAGGWRDGKTELGTDYIYPLVDEDNASYLLTMTDDNKLEGSFVGSSGNYGNLYWWNGDEEEPVFLSWKGTPSRHFRLPSTVSIDGFTTQETASPGLIEDTPFFTSFGQHIYQDGSIFITAPRYNWPYSGQDRCFVLGAAQDTEGTVWAVMQSDRYNVPRYIAIFSNGHRITTEDSAKITEYISKNPNTTIVFQKEYETKKGIYTVLWKSGGPVDGWTLVAEWNTGRQGLPWFGNISGTSFVNPLGTVIDITGTKTEQLPTQGTYKEQMIGGDSDSFCSHGLFEASYSGSEFFEYVSDTVQKGSLSLSFIARTLKEFVSPKTKVYEGKFKQLYDPDGPAPIKLRWSGSIWTTTVIFQTGGTFTLGAEGGQGDWAIEYTGFTVEDGIVTSATGCGTGSVTVTDACGDSITRPVRLPQGYWAAGPEEYATLGSLYCSDPDCYTCSGMLSSYSHLVGSRLVIGSFDCQAFIVGGGSSVAYNSVEQVSTRTVTGCSYFTTTFWSGCGFGCGSASGTKIPASGGNCTAGNAWYVRTDTWVCP